MFMVNGLCRALIYKSCNKYFHKKKEKNSLTSRRQSFNCQTFTNTHSHIPTLFRVLYMLFLGRDWILCSPTHQEKMKKIYPPPKSRKPSLTWYTKCLHNCGALQPYRACSKRCYCFSYSLAWQQTGIWGHHLPNSGYYSQHHCELGFKQNYNSWIWYSESCILFSKDWNRNIAIDSLTSQYSKTKKL